jgi:TolB-like protein/Tfp pilus assembly protein PilF
VKSLETKNVLEPSGDEIRAACERIVASQGFRNSDRMVRFLRFVVEKTLAGAEGDLKEYLLGVEVFDRSESFDPKLDTIVRVEARRLRKKLKEYYDGEGAAERVRIDIPGPGYVPSIAGLPDPLAAEPAAKDYRPALLWAAAAIAVIGAALWWTTHRSAPIDSIAVLPFADLSSAKDQEYFCDGFTEELISTLASAGGLRVVARTSAFAFKGKSTDIREIARVLNAAAIVEGSVRRSDGTMRVTAQLIRASDGYHIWAKSYDRKLEDVLVVQQEIAEQIVASLSRQLSAESRPASELKVADLESHDLYLLGRHHWNKFDPMNLEKAIGYFQKAVQLDPKSSQAYSGLADAYSYMIDGDLMPTAKILPLARDAADRALALDPNLAEAHTARGLVAHELEWDQIRAEREFVRAIQLKPSYAYGIHWYAHYLESKDLFDEALKEMRRAIEIDPLSRIFLEDSGMILWKMRRYGEALEIVKHVEQMDPDFPLVDIMYGGIYQAQRDWPRAIDAYRRAAKRMPGVPFPIGALAQTEALSGDLEAARGDLAKLNEIAAKQYVPDQLFALVYNAMGNQPQARAFLKQAVNAHSGFLVWMRNAPVFDGLAADPECKALLARVGR